MTYDDFDLETQEFIIQAQQLAANLNHEKVTLAHLILAVMRCDEIQVMLHDVADRGGFEKLQNGVFRYLPSKDSELSEKQYLSENANQALAEAKRLRDILKMKQISLEILLTGIVSLKENDISELFDQCGIEPLEILQSIELE